MSDSPKTFSVGNVVAIGAGIVATLGIVATWIVYPLETRNQLEKHESRQSMHNPTIEKDLRDLAKDLDHHAKTPNHEGSDAVLTRIALIEQKLSDTQTSEELLTAMSELTATIDQLTKQLRQQTHERNLNQ